MAKEITFGVLPYFRGAYQPGTTYSQLNQVVYNGSTYQSEIDGNNTVPADGKGNPNKNWVCVARGNDELFRLIESDQVVIANFLAALNSRVSALEETKGQFGDVNMKTVSLTQVPMVCGRPMVVIGAGAPTAESIPEREGVPDFAGQIYISADNKKVYIATNNASISDWQIMN